MSTVSTPVPGNPPPATGARKRGYAVVDVETTGLSPQHNQVIEVGVVLLDRQGREEYAWSTLIGVADLEDVGPKHIHGIELAYLRGAPTLAAICDLLAGSLAGRVLVAHNVRFDLGFLVPVLVTGGWLEGGVELAQLCTMRSARSFISTPSRSLVSCCQAAGVPLAQHHTALDDARASAGLLRHYLNVAAQRGNAEPWALELEAAAEGLAHWAWDAVAAQAQAGLLRLRPV
ncbi:DNA polymerase III polC-type [Actinomyces bovis]|uniref:DNA polymerase III polC-type n=1 Tax=Actinomyces bovis TaxID=1658 RepID=A0ABY1VNF3_9ACTO|nr:exonuclease domain-containing protein [Actinomyces bovis]SPT53575.1 DNA polymerase III polC-type [Actinomyces bovis]VEG55572.1 DNA polymerase III polC-type [Actinomyces israelii]